MGSRHFPSDPRGHCFYPALEWVGVAELGAVWEARVLGCCLILSDSPSSVRSEHMLGRRQKLCEKRWLSALAALVGSTHTGSQTSVTPVQGDPTASSDLQEHPSHVVQRHADRQNTHIQKPQNNLKKKVDVEGWDLTAKRGS